MKHRRVLRVASQPPVVSEAMAMVPPFAGGAVFAALPSVFAGSCQVFLSLSGSVFPVAIGGMAGMTASAAGSGGAVCPSTSAGGAVVFFCVRLRRLRGLCSFVPFDLCGWGSHCWCCDCDACWSWWSACSSTVHGVPSVPGAWGWLACVVCLAGLAGLSLLCQGAPALVGVAVARPVVGSTGEMWLRWRFPSPMASSRRSGSFAGHPRYEVLDRCFHPLLVAPSLEGASAWFFLPLG